MEQVQPNAEYLWQDYSRRYTRLIPTIKENQPKVYMLSCLIMKRGGATHPKFIFGVIPYCFLLVVGRLSTKRCLLPFFPSELGSREGHCRARAVSFSPFPSSSRLLRLEWQPLPGRATYKWRQNQPVSSCCPAFPPTPVPAPGPAQPFPRSISLSKPTGLFPTRGKHFWPPRRYRNGCLQQAGGGRKVGEMVQARARGRCQEKEDAVL